MTEQQTTEPMIGKVWAETLAIEALGRACSPAATPREDRRADLVAAAQCLRCPDCGSAQVFIRDFTSRTSDWQCRMCRHQWGITE